MKLLATVFTALLFLAGCELVGVGVMVVSGPECGEFGLPAGLDENAVRLYDWDQIDSSLAASQDHEQTHNPDVLFALGFLHVRKAVTLSNDPAHNRLAVHYLTWAALCGGEHAVSYLGGFHRAGLLGLKKNPELGACLKRVYELHRDERALIPGRVWACGLRMADVEE